MSLLRCRRPVPLRADVTLAGTFAVLLGLSGIPLGPITVSAGDSVPPLPNPPGLSNAAMAYDPLDNYTVLFGGIEGYPGTTSNETWAFVRGNWTELHPPVSPPATNGAFLTYDSSDGYLLLYEALVVVPGGGGATWSFVHGVWTNRTPAPGLSPPILGESSMSFDPVDGYAVLFGVDYRDPALNQTWAYSGGAWRNITSSPSPAGLSQWLLAWDPTTASLLHLGGLSPAGLGGTEGPLCADFWSFLHGGWSPSSDEGPCEAAPGSVMTYDSADSVLLEYSGDANGTCFAAPCNATWLFNGSAWHATTTALVPPLAQYSFPAAAYDPYDREVVLFGGNLLGPNGANVTRSNQTWTFSGDAWHGGKAPAQTPPSTKPISTLSPDVERGVLVGALVVSGVGVGLYLRSRRR